MDSAPLPSPNPTEITAEITIHAPAAEVFALLVHPEKRLQLHPEWGTFRPMGFSSDFPREGSVFQLEYPRRETPPAHVKVIGFEPDRLFAYRINDERRTEARWVLTEKDTITHLVYTERFVPPAELEYEDIPESELDDQTYLPDTSPELQAQREAGLWLDSLKRYAELRESKGRLAVKAFIDRFVLTLRGDQRRIILGLVAFQIVMCLTFLCAVLGFGAIRWVF